MMDAGTLAIFLGVLFGALVPVVFIAHWIAPPLVDPILAWATSAFGALLAVLDPRRVLGGGDDDE